MKQMTDELCEDPFGEDVDAPHKQPGYSIERGSAKDPDDSPEAQGRRAYHHLRRIRQAFRLGKTKRGALAEEVAELEVEKARVDADLARARKALKDVDLWAMSLCRPDRALLAIWRATAEQFTAPDKPREKTVEFSDTMALASETKTRAAQFVLVDEGAVMRQFPHRVRQVPKLEWGEVRKELIPTTEGILSPNGEFVEGVQYKPRVSEELYFALIDGERVPLSGGDEDGDEAGTDDGAGDTGAGATDDPFGE